MDGSQITQWRAMRLAPAIAVFLMFLLHFFVNLVAQFRRDEELKILLTRSDRLLFFAGVAGVCSIYFYHADIVQGVLAYISLITFGVMLLGLLNHEKLSQQKRSIMTMIFITSVWVWLSYLLIDFIVLVNKFDS